MSGFAFRDRTLKLTIAGNDFGIEVDAENGKIVKSISEEAVGVVKAYQSDNKTEKEAIASFKGFINQVLSDKKASSKIFAAHTPDIRDCMDVLTYIANEIASFNQKSARIEGAELN